MACGNCGGGMGAGVSTCGSCGFSSCGGCGMGMAPGISTCGGCGWTFGRRNRDSLSSEVGTYMADKAAVEQYETSGRGDDPMASVARAGMQAAQIKIVVGIVTAVIFLIIFLVVLSKMRSQPNSLAPLGVRHLLAVAARAPWAGLR